MPDDPNVSLSLPHRLRFARNVFGDGGGVLREFLAPEPEGNTRLQAVVDSGVHRAHPGLSRRIGAWAESAGIEVAAEPLIVPGGEVSKNDPTILDTILRTLHDAKLDRRSYALVVGGGAVLDVVGYAASIVHRGVRLVRVPSTTLAQCDSGVGVKNGVNAYGKKNYLGTFAVPWAVVNDEALLESQSDADWLSGFSEVVKVALLKDAALFDAVEGGAPAVASRDMGVSVPLIRRSAILHLEHICDGGEPPSSSTRPARSTSGTGRRTSSSR